MKNVQKIFPLRSDEEHQGDEDISIYRIEDQVFEKLIQKDQILTAKAYEGYRKVREFQRETNTIDNEVFGIVTGENQEALDAKLQQRFEYTGNPEGSDRRRIFQRLLQEDDASA